MKRAFLIAIFYTAVSVLLSFPISYVGSKLIFVLALFALGLIFFFIFRRDLSTYQFAATIFVLLSLIIAYSTFQARSYIYYTFWFNSLLVLFLISLISCVLMFKPKITLHYFSYILIHGGLLVVALGFIVNALRARKLYFTLYRGQPTNRAFVMRNVEITNREVEVPFTLELLDFKVKYYNEPELIFVYKKFGKKYRAIQSYPVKVGSKIKLPGLSFSVKGMYNREIFTVEKKIGVVKIASREFLLEEGKVFEWNGKRYVFLEGIKVPEHFLLLRRADNSSDIYVISPGLRLVIDNMLVKILKFYPNFRFDVDRGIALSDGDEPKNPVIEVSVFYKGRTYSQYLFSNKTGFSHPLTIGDMTIDYLYRPDSTIEVIEPDSIYMERVKFEGEPIITVQFNGGDTARLEIGGDPYYVKDFALLFDRNPKQEKGYESIVRFVYAGKIEETIIKVNKPYKFMGYKFYQSDYDPQNPDFSGIMAVKEPGENVIYVGLFITFVGVIINFIYRRKQWS